MDSAESLRIPQLDIVQTWLLHWGEKYFLQNFRNSAGLNRKWLTVP